MPNQIDEAGGGGEFLTFRLGAEEYAIDILRVQEIRTADRPTAIAGTPRFILGVIDLRGTIVPIVDLRLKFALTETRCDAFTVAIILNVADRVVGVVVDAVSDVVSLAQSDIRAMPELGAAVDARFLTGIGRLDERMLILLDIEKLMTSREMALVDDAAALAAAV